MTTVCETCAKEIGSVTCPQCKEDVLRLGPNCYLCGAQLVISDEICEPEVSGENDDFSNRVLCSDGTCIGVIDEKGICKICGKPYVQGSE
ncbi:MAG: hypothetical protein PHT96_09000 [Syntrophorhabdaceae bacterium]|nr:hypothetical protein [Syntrophorhabdaceae bacterium]MDD4196532.1 hypothetical protein [Syntrophorhabdaceae bacterium]HOC45407.1 hypothetical protein [Syntrophorhabdaceae bacterium]